MFIPVSKQTFGTVFVIYDRPKPLSIPFLQEEQQMKLSFSTLACHDFEWSDIYSMAKDLGFDGIEIRGLGDDIFSVKAKPFTEKQLPATISKLNSLGLEISCFSSGAALRFKERSAENKNEIVEYMKLASKMGTSFIRVLADDGVAPSGLTDDDFII
jgi:hypothetical protein